MRTEVQHIKSGCSLVNKATSDVLKNGRKTSPSQFARNSACSEPAAWEIFCSDVFHIQTESYDFPICAGLKVAKSSEKRVFSIVP
jgi:hypothetical protein